MTWTDLKLSHYTDLDTLRPYSEPQSNRAEHKPEGLWLSVDGEDDWYEWCDTEGFRSEKMVHKHIITLHETAKIIHLQDKDVMEMFTGIYGENRPYSSRESKYIRWYDVAKEGDGIIISPYQYSCRMEDHMWWYYTWDCASGCIWNASCIKSVTLDTTYKYKGAKSDAT